MKRFFVSAAVATLFVAASLPTQAADVGVSVQISQPGIYGRIDIGQFPQPVLVVNQPIIVQRPVYVVQQPQPVYMWVPPGHRKKWSKHCGEYNACGVPVYFVQDRWYDSHVRPGHGGEQGYQQGQDRGKSQGKDKDKGKGNGNGNGKGKD